MQQGCDVNAKDKDGRRPLHYVSSSEVAGYLAGQGADINAKADNGWTPIDVAMNEQEDEVAEFLISRGGVVSKVPVNNRGA